MKDADLAAKARHHRELGLQIKALEAEQETVGDELTAELRRRKATSREVDGVTVTLTSRRYGYDPDRLKERLRPGVFREVTRTAVDAKALERAVKAGRATEEDRTAAELRTREYPVVTVREAA